MVLIICSVEGGLVGGRRWVWEPLGGIGWCRGGPLMLRSPKLKKWASDPEWAQNGGFKNCTPQNWAPQGSLAHGPKMGVQKSTPNGPLWGQLPIVGFWAPEGGWGWG